MARRHFRAVGELLADTFRDAPTIEDFLRDVRTCLVTCWNYTNENRVFARLFFDAEAWAVMRETDWEDSFINAQRTGAALQPLVPHIASKRILALCIIICDGASTTARLALRFGDIRNELFDEFLELVESHVYALLRESSSSRRMARVALPG